MVSGKHSLCCATVLAHLLASVCVAAETSQAIPEEGASQFLRLTRDENDSPLALEVAIVRHVPMDCGQTGPTVDLISAVHVAEPGYYAQLNRQFKDYDAVLYEMVAPKGARIAKGGGSGSTNPVSALQRAMTSMLDLQFQLDGIDYDGPNLVHADMSPKQFARSMSDRGESMFQVFLRMMGYALSRQEGTSTGPSDAQVLVALFSKDRALALKRVLAEQFTDLEGSLLAINGPDGSTLITERNKVAAEVLGKEIAAGKQKIAIFYGAGHMPDFQKRLRDDYGLVPINTTWLMAWDLKGRPAGESRHDTP